MLVPLHHHLKFLVDLRVFGFGARSKTVFDCIGFRTLRRHGTLMFLLVERLQVSADRFTWPHRPRALNLHMHVNLTTPRRARSLAYATRFIFPQLRLREQREIQREKERERKKERVKKRGDEIALIKMKVYIRQMQRERSALTISACRRSLEESTWKWNSRANEKLSAKWQSLSASIALAIIRK